METITNMNPETIDGLKDLVRVNVDSTKGFLVAADQVENLDLAALFRNLSQQRGLHADQLRGFVKMNDEEASDSGSIKGRFHRWWLNLRGTITGGDEHAILAEAERGEDVIKERYEEVLKQTAGSPVNNVLQSHYADVKASHDAIRDMRDAAAK